jgi:nucleotide-binding universal stress UspA family protein
MPGGSDDYPEVLPSTSGFVVPLDGSALDDLALSFAIPLARSTAAPLHLLRAVPLQIELTRRLDAGALRRAHRKAQRIAKAALHRKAVPLRQSGLEIRTHTRSGAPAAVILDAAREFDARLIVLASRARGGIVRWLMGSVADEVLRHASVPVLVVRADDTRPWPDERPPRLLVGLDGSPFSEAGLAAAAEFAEHSAELLLVRVVQTADHAGNTDVPVAAAAMIREDTAAAERYLQGVAGSHRDKGRRVETRVVIGASPAVSLSRAASDEDVDVMVVATHGRGGLTRLALGSVATSLLHDSPVPLLVVRPDDRSGTATEDEETDVRWTSAP